MAAIIKNAFRTFAAAKAREAFFPSAKKNSLYLGVGRLYTWAVDGVVSDVPPASNVMLKSLQGDLLDWEDMYFMKRLASSMVSHSIAKKIWSRNKQYDPYRHDWDGLTIKSVNGTFPRSISDSDFYVITSNYNLYVCIQAPVSFTAGNNRQVGITSQDPDLAQPLAGSPSSAQLFKGTDGYIWKYIASTSSQDVIQFSTNDFHPVKTVDTSQQKPVDVYGRQWQSQVDSANYRGGIYSIIVGTRGSGYNGSIAGTKIVVDSKNGTTGLSGSGEAVLKVVGNGVGLEYRVIFGTNGTIENVEVINPGYGYTYAKIVILSAGTGAELTPILTPTTGLGVDPIYDFDAFNISVFAELNDDEGDITINNDYRKICLIANPTTYGSNVIPHNQPYADLAWNVEISGDLGALNDDQIISFTSGVVTVKAKVLDFNTTTSVLRVMRTRRETNHNHESQIGVGMALGLVDAISDVVTPTGITVLSVTPPEAQLGSGNVLYSEYRYPLRRSDNQTEQIRIVVEF